MALFGFDDGYEANSRLVLSSYLEGRKILNWNLEVEFGDKLGIQWFQIGTSACVVGVWSIRTVVSCAGDTFPCLSFVFEGRKLLFR